MFCCMGTSIDLRTDLHEHSTQLGYRSRTVELAGLVQRAWTSVQDWEDPRRGCVLFKYVAAVPRVIEAEVRWMSEKLMSDPK